MDFWVFSFSAAVNNGPVFVFQFCVVAEFTSLGQHLGLELLSHVLLSLVVATLVVGSSLSSCFRFSCP